MPKYELVWGDDEGTRFEATCFADSELEALKQWEREYVNVDGVSAPLGLPTVVRVA